MNDLLLEKLQAIEGLQVRKNISLADFSNWKVGGSADVLVQPTTLDQITKIREKIREGSTPNLIIGNTTNLLFTDENINAVLIQLGNNYSKVSTDGSMIKAQAGIWVPKLARSAMQAGLTGIEHICGIPGTLGGLVVMNGGSQRKGIGDQVLYVKTIDNNGIIKEYTQSDCLFSYRSSIFQSLEEIIVEVGLQLEPVINKKSIHGEMLTILRSRTKKFPRKLPNCGSVFISNPAMYKKYGPPGKIIEECGLKGMVKGRAQISYDHANFIVNNGDASSEDILYLINCVRDKVLEKTGYLMKVEAKFVNSFGEVVAI